MGLTFANCDSHPSLKAGWRCTHCSAALCPACTAERRTGTQMMDICTRCQGMAEPIRERRALLQPFAVALPSALLWPFRGTGPLWLLGFGIFTYLASFVGFAASLIARGILVGYLFHVTRWTSLGHEEVPGAQDMRGFFEDMVAPWTRSVLATLWVTVPVILLLWGSSQWQADLRVVALVAAAGLTIVPISLLASAVETPLAQILNPLVLAGYAWKLGADYLLLLVFGAFLLLVLFLLNVARAAVGGGASVDILFNVLRMAVPFAFFLALGLLLRARGDDLGYGSQRDYLEPVLGAARPEAVLAEPAPSSKQASRAVVGPIDVDTAAPAQNSPVELAERVRQGDLEGALSLLEASPADVPALTLSAEAWLLLGQAGAEQRRFPPALVALRRAIDVAPQGPLAPAAWLLAARLYDEGLRNRAQSDRLLAELARLFPESKEGEFAARRLRAAGR